MSRNEIGNHEKGKGMGRLVQPIWLEGEKGNPGNGGTESHGRAERWDRKGKGLVEEDQSKWSVYKNTKRNPSSFLKKIQEKEEKTRDGAMENSKQKHSETEHPSMRERKFQDKNIK